jgi:hypothetical protein
VGGSVFSGGCASQTITMQVAIGGFGVDLFEFHVLPASRKCVKNLLGQVDDLTRMSFPLAGENLDSEPAIQV